ncbi:MAG: HNH endonuclease domain-containing protein [Candidatus Stygibacter australis]|nr:HNH endonuclease domain-containing protein [Candidatus Stygibacter australis]
MNPIALDLFDAYKSNLTKTGNNPELKDIILCPLCLKEIKREEIVKGDVALEHIIPAHSTGEKAQKTDFTKISVKNVRSGLTITCSKCNSKKGSKLDWVLRNRITPGSQNAKNGYSFTSGVAILVYAYLFSFAVFGYEYILKDELIEIRKQFSDIDNYHTKYLEYAQVNLNDPEQPIVCNEWGYPLIMGETKNGDLEIYFWKFRARLPSISGLNQLIEIPQSIKKLTDE